MTRHVMRTSVIGIVAWAGAIGGASTASAQSNGSYAVVITNEVNPTHPSTNVEIWATWSGPDFLFGGGDFDLTASDSTFLSGTNIINGPGTTVGEISGNTVTGAKLGQVHLPPLGLFGLPDNPILLASYEWMTTDFTWRTVRFETSNTNNFIVVTSAAGEATQLFPSSFTPGSGNLVIGIFPSPSTISAFALGGVVAFRRKRRS